MSLRNFKFEMIKYIKENTTNCITDIEIIQDYEWEEYYTMRLTGQSYDEIIDYMLDHEIY